MRSSLIISLIAAATAETAAYGGPSPYVIGVIALVVLLTLLFITMAFRNVRTRNRRLRADRRARHGGH